MDEFFVPEPGSFRDRGSKVFYRSGEVYRGLSEQARADWTELSKRQFFARRVAAGCIAKTEPAGLVIPEFSSGLKQERIPFISYPYEWSFGMLKDAALLHLDLLAEALAEGMIIKDSSAFNIQWQGCSPVFIDVSSFKPLREGQAWEGYRQFCRMFLFPLLLRALRGIPFQPWLRGDIEGIDVQAARGLLGWMDGFKNSSVFADVILHAASERRYQAQTSGVRGEIASAGFTPAMIVRNVARLRRAITKLEIRAPGGGWMTYAGGRDSYSDEGLRFKKDFVARAISRRHWKLVWDLGCNLGEEARAAAESADTVVALDSDEGVIESFYRALKGAGVRNVLPLVCDLAQPPSALGWRQRERMALEQRGRPELVICVALIHHLCLGANIPLGEWIEWLASLGGAVVLEFVDKADPRAAGLLKNRDDQHADYTRAAFEQQVDRHFKRVESAEVPGGTRFIYFLENPSPKR